MKDKWFHNLVTIPKRNKPIGINVHASVLPLNSLYPSLYLYTHRDVTFPTVIRTHHRILILPLTLGSNLFS